MQKKSTFLTNAWYAAAMSAEVGPDALFNRKILDTSVLIYRKQDGSPVALHDRCPHRFAPLSMGKRCGDEVACPYHALRFNDKGQCTHSPHGDGRIPNSAQVRVFPLLERYGFVWIWMGDTPADTSRLPAWTELDEGPATGVAHTYMHMKANYELIIDNVMDLSHVDHVHGEIISTRGQLSPLTPLVKESGTTVSSRNEWTQTPGMLIFNQFLPEPMGEARMFVEVTWTPPANIQLSIGATQDAAAQLNLEECTSQFDLHTCTPETSSTTHYFFATRRNHLIESGEYNEGKIRAMHTAFETEDGPIIDAVQQEMDTDDFFSLRPSLTTNDLAPVKVRRLLKKLIEAEQVAAAASRVKAEAVS